MDINNLKNELNYIKSIRNNDDFIKAFIVEEDKPTIWIVIKNSTFDFNKKYLSSVRNFKINNSSDFNIVIFDEEQIPEVSEQLNDFNYYEAVI